MYDFIPGQRWINNADAQMGLGTVQTVEHRTVTLLFPATGETRIYARETAPLTRVRFAPGDTVLSQKGWGLTVETVTEADGLLTYNGVNEDEHPASLDESQLNHFIQLNRPTERLFNGQIDHNRWFALRHETWQRLSQLRHSNLYGMTGCRTSLIPHQLYIANEVAHRYAPRVLLADEVGLGKTIEAGLILHQQLLAERARRVLIVVPENLIHQWLVEMLRRFNLHFSIFDEARCAAIDEAGDGTNSFHTEQLILCSLEFLVRDDQRFAQALAGEWDLLVVDEAHHLQWSPQQVSPEYRRVEQLAAETAGVLLLTATPEQLGKASHFARLRLLDPDRFPDFNSYLEQEQAYGPLSDVVEALLNDTPLGDAGQKILRDTISEGDNQALLDTLAAADHATAEHTDARLALAEHLLDRHGTGRVMFRNTRASVAGFPDRTLHDYPLPLPAEYASLRDSQDLQPRLLLSPELGYQATAEDHHPPWTDFDPRIPWLCQLLAQVKPDKVLVITADAGSTLNIASALKSRLGLHASIFHEGMSIVERDRAAAFFANQQDGGQVLVCSEIGSEGRNFQFAHQLVLFDLPLNPDLLEQRIGRLDRIGQRHTIRIHVPWLENSAQASMFRWYQQGLDAFEHTCPAGHSVFVKVRAALIAALQDSIGTHEALFDTTRHYREEMNEALHNGRDRLLEYNSCRPQAAASLRMTAIQQDKKSTLPEYMDIAFDCFGVDTEIHSHACYVIRPGEHLACQFPGLPDDGATITYERETALANEDIQYLTWEHPMVTGVMDRILGSEQGNTAITTVPCKQLKPGTLLIEALYAVEPATSETLQTSRFLPPTTVRLVIDEHGNDHTARLTHAQINRSDVVVDAETANAIVRAREKTLRALIPVSRQAAESLASSVLASAREQAEEILTTEISRLKALGKVNPNVRDDEIRYFETHLAALSHAIESANLRLDALRLIIAT